MQTTSGTLPSCSVIEAGFGGSLFLLALSVAPFTLAGELHANVKTSAGGPVADAVVVLIPLDGQVSTARPEPAVVDQIDKQFVPYVKPILVGSEISFPNKDNIRHQVYSFSPAKRFELPLYREYPAPPVLFDKAGIVTLGCNIHDWMIAYVYVSDSPWFAKTGDEGTAKVADLPDGKYRVRVWHPQMDATGEDTIREVAITGQGNVEAIWQITLKPELRPRRAPLGREQGYR